MVENEGISLRQQECFCNYFPYGHITMLTTDLIPKTAMHFFERMSAMFILPEKYKKGNFNSFFVIFHDDGSRTYLATQDKTYWNKQAENLVYFADITQSGLLVGNGEMRNSTTKKSDYFKDKPFVGSTNTKENVRRNGLGTRRLLMMNAVSQMLYGLSLNSSTTIIDNAEIRIWERLTTNGAAREYSEGKMRRFVFL